MINWFKNFFIRELDVILGDFNKVLTQLDNFVDHRQQVVADINAALNKLADERDAHHADIDKAQKVAANIQKLIS